MDSLLSWKRSQATIDQAIKSMFVLGWGEGGVKECGETQMYHAITKQQLLKSKTTTKTSNNSGVQAASTLKQ